MAYHQGGHLQAAAHHYQTVLQSAPRDFHALRLFFASWLLAEGFSLKKAQGLLGHATMAMTADTYGHLLPDLENDAAKMAAGELALVG